MEELEIKIQERYKEESQNSCNLSCGNNLSFLDLSRGENVLDLGCGKGLETLEAAAMVGDTGKAVGLDITPDMLHIAEENAKEQKASNVEFVVGDIEQLPFPDDSFHAVISNCVINHARSKLNVYKEIYRILIPGGRFVVSDAVTKYPLPESIKDDPEQWAACFGGAITEEEYLDSIRGAGFQHIDILNRREYLKNGYDFISLTIKACK